MASYDAAINVIIGSQDKLKKLYENLEQVEQTINRIATQKIPTIQMQIDRSRIDAQLAAISQQFRRRDYRLNVNDTAVKAATINVGKLNEELATLTSKSYIVEIGYVEKNKPAITGAGIGKKAAQAKSQGLSGKLSEILAAGEASVAALANADKINALSAKLAKSNVSSGGFNVPGLREVIRSLGGKPVEGAKRAELQKQADQLLREVDDQVLNAVYDRLIDLKMQLKPIRGSGLTTSRGPQASRSTPNMQEIIDRMAYATTRPGTAESMLRKIPEQYINLDLAEIASRQMRYFEQVPLARRTYSESKYFDPLLKAIAQAFARYTRSISPRNPWFGAPGGELLNSIMSPAFMQKISGSTKPFGLLPPATVQPFGLLPKIGGTVASKSNRIPNLGIDDDIMRLRGMQEFIRSAYQALERETRALRGASGQMPLGSSALMSGRLLPPAGGTGGSIGAGSNIGGGGVGFGGPGGPGGEGMGPFGYGPFNVPPLGPASRRADRQRFIREGRLRQAAQRRALSEGLVGGAFPLLFGQGLGASLGGGLGGTAGGFMGGGLGFGLSLVGTALGSVFDQVSAAAQETGKSLNYPIEGFEKLKQANLFASREQEYYIQKLIESGQTARAQGEIQSEIIKKIGVSGTNDLMALGDSASQLSKAWGEFNLQLQAALAGPLAGILGWLTEILKLQNQSMSSERRASEISAGLSGDARQAFDAELGNIARRQSIGNKFGPLFGGISTQEANRQRNVLSNFYAPFAEPPKPQSAKNDPAQQEEALNKSIEVADRIRAINEQGIALQRSADDLRLSIEDTVYGLRKRATDMEREAVNFRRSVEDEVFNKRQELEKLIIDNDRKRQQNAIDSLDLQLQSASSGLDPIAQGVVDAARQYIRVRAEGEADLQQNERQLKLDLQKLDQEVNRYKLQVEERVSQMMLQRDEFTRDVARTKLQIEQQIGDYVIKVEKYRLDMAKLRVEEAVREGNVIRATEIARQEGLGVTPTGRNYANVGAYMNGRQELHGIPGFAGYRADHAGAKAHYHFAGQNPRETKSVADYLKGLGIQITEFGQYGQQVGEHAAGSQHYRERGYNAFDVPGSQVPVGQEIAMMKRVHALINDFLMAGPVAPRAGSATPVAAPPSRQAPSAPGAPTMPQLPQAPQLVTVNDLMGQYFDIQKQIVDQMQKSNGLERASLQIRSEAARLQYEQQALAPIAQFEEQNRQLQFEIEKRKERNRLAAEGYSPEYIDGQMRVLELDKTLNSVLTGNEVAAARSALAAAAQHGANLQLIDSTFNLTEATAAELLLTVQDVKQKEELRKKLEAILKLKNDISGKAQATADTARFGIQAGAEQSIMSPAEKYQEEIGRLKLELEKLVDPINQITSAGAAIGSAFSNSFQGIISGSMSAQQALASFFQSTADYFLDMAGKIIAQMIQMAILNAVVGLLPGAKAGNMGGANYFSPKTGLGVAGPNFGLALGGIVGSNGIEPFARGGIVTSPTLFKFANGGALRTGLMGEAGPEAVMPLKRGPGGRLGVDASGSGGGVNVTVNVDATGSSVQGDGRQAGELGRALSAAVQQELIKQKRPGGLLA